MNSYTVTTARTFTITHAMYLAAKVATDLKRMQRFYGSPSDLDIINYEKELIVLLKYGYLKKIYYGFKKNGSWINLALLIYEANEFSDGVDDDPGKISIKADVSGATFYSFLEYSYKWEQLSDDEKADFEQNKLPFRRTYDNAPRIEGYLHYDLRYYSGGVGLSRSSIRSY